MEPTPTALYVAGIGLGTLASEVTWRATRSFVGTGTETPPLRVIIAVAAIFVSPALIAVASTTVSSLSSVESSTWIGVLTACLVGQLWLGPWTFARLTLGKPHELLQALAIALNISTAMVALLLAGKDLMRLSTSGTIALAVAVLTIEVSANRVRTIRDL